MSPMEFLLLAILAVPAVGLMVSGVMLIRVRDRFSPKGYAVTLVLGILTTSLGVTLALVFSFTAINLGVETVSTHEFGTVEVRTQ